MGKRKGRQLDTEFLAWADEEILAALRDPRTPKALRRRLRRHAKALGLRNIQKRRKS